MELGSRAKTQQGRAVFLELGRGYEGYSGKGVDKLGAFEGFSSSLNFGTHMLIYFRRMIMGLRSCLRL